MPGLRPTYREDYEHAESTGFVPGAYIKHYSTGNLYRIISYFKVTDNSSYDGRLGILYVYGGEVYGRPYAQMIEPHVHGDDFEQQYRFEVVP